MALIILGPKNNIIVDINNNIIMSGNIIKNIINKDVFNIYIRANSIAQDQIEHPNGGHKRLRGKVHINIQMKKIGIHALKIQPKIIQHK